MFELSFLLAQEEAASLSKQALPSVAEIPEYVLVEEAA
jgi:hypothetical protein